MKALLLILVWSVYGGLLLRAISIGKLKSSRDYLIWVQVGLCFLALSLWGPDREALLDHVVGVELPFALWLKYGLFMVSCYLYTHLLAQLPPLAHYSRQMRPFWALAIGLALLLALTTSDHPHQRYMIIGVRDSLVSVYLVLVFVPGTHHLLQAEQVFGMRLKHVALLVFALSFIMTSAGSAAAGIIALMNWGDPYPASIAWQNWIYPGVIAVLVALVPYNWLFTHRLERIYTYLKLRRLVRQLQSVTPPGTYPYTPLRGWQLINAYLVDLHIYQLVVLINDRQSILRQSDKHFYSQVNTCLQTHQDFVVLSHHLAEIV